MKEKIDIERCRRGLQQLSVEGYCNSETIVRLKAIEDAIISIQQSPKDALKELYIGVKNYAGFGDQRENHRYGMGPKHGTIVFSIERKQRNDSPENVLDSDAIYLLECIRDNGDLPHSANGQSFKVNISYIINYFDNASREAKKYLSMIDIAEVDSMMLEAQLNATEGK